ncbi:hypothetical protein KH5H1_35450 [Corallococcus caeni]|nr:hypothetical protein KH5H1_35450 [Corallococcus sp. KH5-1]
MTGAAASSTRRSWDWNASEDVSNARPASSNPSRSARPHMAGSPRRESWGWGEAFMGSRSLRPERQSGEGARSGKPCPGVARLPLADSAPGGMPALVYASRPKRIPLEVRP